MQYGEIRVEKESIHHFDCYLFAPGCPAFKQTNFTIEKSRKNLSILHTSAHT